MWSRDGAVLYYRTGTTRWSVKLSTTPVVRVLARDTLMTPTSDLINGASQTAYDVSRDGRYLALVSSKDDYQLVVVPNWRAELEQRLAASGKK